MRRLKMALLLVWYCCCSLPLFSQNFTWQGLRFEVVTDAPAVARIANARRCMASFTVPATVPYRGRDYAVKVMGYEAFSNLDCIYRIDLAEVETIEDGWAQYYSDNGTTRYHGSFVHCSQLEAVNFQQVKQVGDYAFFGCSQLAEIRLPAVAHIGKSAFQRCGVLKEIVLGENLQDLGDLCFAQSSALQHITLLGQIPPRCNDSVFMQNVYDEAELRVPVGTKAAYEQAEGWRNFKKLVEVAPAAVADVVQHPVVMTRVSKTSVRIAGVPRGTKVTVLDRSGRRVKTVISSGSPMEINLLPGQPYLIEINGKIEKLVL